MCFYFTHSFLNWSTFHLVRPLFATPNPEAFVNCGTHKYHNSHLVTGRCKLHKTKSVRNHGIHGEKFCNYHKNSQFVQSFFEVAERILILKSHKILVSDVSHKKVWKSSCQSELYLGLSLVLSNCPK